MSNSLVVKNNALINASYRLSLAEQRLVLLSIVEARRMGANITPMDKLTVSADIYAKAFNTTRQASYMALKEACDNLFNREYGYMEILEKGVRVVRSRWVSEIAYNKQQATVDLIFAPSIVPYITNLEKQFTSYDLEQVAGLNSRYAVRLYEIVIAWKNNGKTNQISIEDLRDRLGILDDEYQRMELFKRKVLDLAVKQINEKTDITLSYEQHKQGRKIVGFTFTIDQKPPKTPLKTASNAPKTASDEPTALDDQEQQIIANTSAYAESIGASPSHRKNLIKKALNEHRTEKQRQEQAHLEAEQAEKARKQAQEAQKQQAEQLYQKILSDDNLINRYAISVLAKRKLNSLQKILFEQGDFRGAFKQDKHRFDDSKFINQLIKMGF